MWTFGIPEHCHKYYIAFHPIMDPKPKEQMYIWRDSRILGDIWRHNFPCRSQDISPNAFWCSRKKRKRTGTKIQNRVFQKKIYPVSNPPEAYCPKHSGDRPTLGYSDSQGYEWTDNRTRQTWYLYLPVLLGSLDCNHHRKTKNRQWYWSGASGQGWKNYFLSCF